MKFKQKNSLHFPTVHRITPSVRHGCPDDGGSTLLWNVDQYILDYTSQTRHREKLKSDLCEKKWSQPILNYCYSICLDFPGKSTKPLGFNVVRAEPWSLALLNMRQLVPPPGRHFQCDSTSEHKARLSYTVQQELTAPSFFITGR